MSAKLKDVIRATGLRVTASRLAVLNHLQAAARPLTHADVVTELGDGTWDKATLYRNLMDLTEAKLLRRVSLGSTWRFEARDPESTLAIDHPHFVCTGCGDVQCTPHVRLDIHSSGKAPKSVRSGEVEVQLHGLCNTCA